MSRNRKMKHSANLLILLVALLLLTSCNTLYEAFNNGREAGNDEGYSSAFNEIESSKILPESSPMFSKMPAFSAKMKYYLDTKTELYHARGCPKLGKKYYRIDYKEALKYEPCYDCLEYRSP